MFGIKIGEEEKQKAWQGIADFQKSPTYEEKGSGIGGKRWWEKQKISNLFAQNVGWWRSLTQCYTPAEKREAGCQL